MNEQKVKILVACHKPTEVPHDDIYMPIHVGKAISKYKEEMKDMIGDDTGDNISKKNPYYCELTAVYWAWKNLKDIDYIGLCHYRRYFDFHTHGQFMHPVEISKFDTFIRNNRDGLLKTIEKFKDNEIILPYEWSMPQSTQENLSIEVSGMDWQILYGVIKKLYPEYIPTVMEYMLGNRRTGYNMFVMSRSQFESYAQWLFSILGECERLVRMPAYSLNQRIYGYMGEVLLPIFCKHNNYKIKRVCFAFISENRNKPRYLIKLKIKDLFCNFVFSLYKKVNKKSLFNDFLLGWLKTDGINLK